MEISLKIFLKVVNSSLRVVLDVLLIHVSIHQSIVDMFFGSGVNEYRSCLHT